MQAKIEIFFSCSQDRTDEKLRDELERHLGLLTQEGHVSVWHRGKIGPGVEEEPEVEIRLNKAHIILLLVSARFITSYSCYYIEMKRAMERHEASEARVIPILLHPVDVELAHFAKLQILPMNRKPITSWPKLDEALAHIAECIRKVVEEITTSTQGLGTVAEKVDSTRLYNTLVRLDYREQVRVFQQFKSEGRQIGVFLIHGAPSFGQGWLLNRLINQLPHSSTALNFIFSFERKAGGRSLKDLWSDLSKWVGHKNPPFLSDSSLEQEIVKRVHELWRRQTVILILNRVHEIDERYVHEFMKTFWFPLTEMTSRTSPQTSKHYLLMFLVDNADCVDGWSVPVTHELDRAWEPHIPIKLERLTSFSHDVLDSWIGYEIDTLPADLTAQSILDNSESGIPEDVLDHICSLFGCQWPDLVKYRV